jgi:hypothetical protein
MTHYWIAKTKNAFFLLVVSTLWLACQKNTDLVPAGFVGARNGYQTLYDTTIDLRAYTVKMDSVITSRLSAYAIGTINDPAFGTSSAALITQVSLPGNGFSWGNGVFKLDSSVLQLRFRNLLSSDGTYFKDYYGDKNAIHTLKVYLLDENLRTDSTYYSSRNYKTTGVVMGSWTGKFNFTDTLTIKQGSQTVVIPPHIRIPMNQTFNDLLYGAELRGEFASQSAFKAAFKGFVVVDESNFGPGGGTIVYVRLNSDVTALTAFYKDSMAADFPIIGGNNGVDASYNYYNHSNVPADLLQAIGSGSHRDTGFVQPLAGTKLRIEIPNLFDAFSNPKLAINGAELTFTPQSGSFTETYPLPIVMSLVGSDSLGKNKFLKDQITEGTNYYGGKLNNNKYSFNIVRHLQDLLIKYKNGANVNYGMHLIVPADNPITAERVILDTRKNSGSFKLKVTYTVIK